MKKILILIIIVSSFIITGCNYKKNKMLKYQEIMEEYGRDYYEEYQKGITSISGFEIKIAKLKEANVKQGKNYELEPLKQCKDSSSVIFTVNNETREIEKVEFVMDCEI